VFPKIILFGLRIIILPTDAVRSHLIRAHRFRESSLSTSLSVSFLNRDALIRGLMLILYTIRGRGFMGSDSLTRPVTASHRLLYKRTFHSHHCHTAAFLGSRRYGDSPVKREPTSRQEILVFRPKNCCWYDPCNSRAPPFEANLNLHSRFGPSFHSVVIRPGDPYLTPQLIPNPSLALSLTMTRCHTKNVASAKSASRCI
jgi:hypothetical protein